MKQKKKKEESRDTFYKGNFDPNEDIIAFSRAIRKSMCVHSSEQVIKLFSRSSRIREDLARILEFPSELKINLIIREWVPMEPEMEFRIFICTKKLTAATQYCYMSYFPELVQNKEKIEKLIQEFIGEILEFLPYENAVVDILVHKFSLNDDNTSDNSDKRNKLKAQIIEINPFFGDTGACLFSWREPSDVEILKNGPFQLRLRENPIDQPYNALPWEWSMWMKDLRGIPRKTREEKPRLKKETESRMNYLGIIGVALLGVIAVLVVNYFMK